MNDVELSFNPDVFVNGIQAIEKQLINLNGHFDKMGTAVNKKAEKMGTAVNKKAEKMKLGFTNVLGILGKLSVVVGAVKFALSGIPELGQSFKVAGDIIQKNLLWPLRKMLIPVLKDMLDWVRDNRKMFLRWGTVLANVFRVVISVVKTVVDMIKNLWNKLFDGLKDIFGKTKDSVMDMANVVLFKIAALVQFILMTIEPVAEAMMDMFVGIVKGIKKSGLGEELMNLHDLVGRLTEALFGSSEGWEKFGEYLATGISSIIRGIIVLIEGLGEAILFVVEGLKTLFSGDSSHFQNYIDDSLAREYSKQNNVSMDEARKAMFPSRYNETTPKGTVTNNQNKSNVYNITDSKKVDITIKESNNPKATAEEVQKVLQSDLQELKYRTGGR